MTAALPSPSLWAKGLGYGGLIPFAGLAAAICLLGPADRAHTTFALLGYGATILSFLGAIHWGLAMREAAPQSTRFLLWGVVPSLIAWVALLVNPVAGLCLLAVGLWACFAVDWAVYRRLGVKAWLPLRLVLTMVASVCCIAGAVGAVR
jgi:hypothetical protein